MAIDLELWKTRRKELRIDYQELANQAEVSLNTIKNIFRGATTDPRLETVQRIERALGIEEEKTPPGEDLSEGEKMLLDLFNRVPEEKQELLLQLIRTALEMQ